MVTDIAYEGECYFCGEVTAVEDYCFICQEFICPKCDVGQPTGDHIVEAHGNYYQEELCGTHPVDPRRYYKEN